MKFSEVLKEYMDLREEGEFHSEWMSIDYVSEVNRERYERMQFLLHKMDEILEGNDGKS